MNSARVRRARAGTSRTGLREGAALNMRSSVEIHSWVAAAPARLTLPSGNQPVVPRLDSLAPWTRTEVRSCPVRPSVGVRLSRNAGVEVVSLQRSAMRPTAMSTRISSSSRHQTGPCPAERYSRSWTVQHDVPGGPCDGVRQRVSRLLLSLQDRKKAGHTSCRCSGSRGKTELAFELAIRQVAAPVARGTRSQKRSGSYGASSVPAIGRARARSGPRLVHRWSRP
jgi:hypothetical protein